MKEKNIYSLRLCSNYEACDTYVNFILLIPQIVLLENFVCFVGNGHIINISN